MNLLKIFKNTFFLFFARALSSFFSLLVVVIIARNLGVDALGKFALIYTYFLVFTEIPLLGLNLFISRELAKKQECFQQLFFISNVLSYISVLILSVILVLIINLAGYPKDVCTSLLWVLFAIIPSGFITVAQAFMLASEKFKQMSFVIISENFLRSLIAILILVISGSIVQIFFSFLVLRLVFFVINFWLLKQARMIPDVFSWDRKLFVFTLRHWPVFSSIYVISILISRIDQILLSKLGSISDVGLYSASYKFLDFFLMAPTALSFALFPLFSRLDLLEIKNKKLVSVIVKYFSILSFPLIAFFLFFSKEFTVFFYGSKFVASALVLSILIWNFLVTGCDQILGLLMISQNKQKMDLKFLVSTLLVYIILLLSLVPKYHYIGAAVATVASSVFLSGLKLFYLGKVIYKIDFSGLYRNIIFMVFLLIITDSLSRYFLIPSLLAWLLSLIFYFGGIFVLGVITYKENQLISRAIVYRYPKLKRFLYGYTAFR